MGRICQFVICLVVTLSVIHATCPTPTIPEEWAYSQGVSYSFQTGTGGPPPDTYNPVPWNTMGSGQSDVISGINLWNTANITANYSYVQFYSGGATAEFFAYWVNYPGSPYSDPGAPSQTQFAIYHGTEIIADIVVTFWFNSTGTGNTVSLSQADPGFDSMMIKATLHEIGHSMGLGDNVFAPAQQSVMNGWSGTNDINNSIATDVTSCDDQSVHTLQ